MFGIHKRRNQKRRRQIIDCVRAIEDAIFTRVSFVIEQQQRTESPGRLSRSVVNKLLAKSSGSNAPEDAVIKQLASDIVQQDEEVRDALFISLLALLSVEGERHNFDAERRILETIQWLKEFGEMPPSNHDLEILKNLAEKLRKNFELVAA